MSGQGSTSDVLGVHTASTGALDHDKSGVRWLACYASMSLQHKISMSYSRNGSFFAFS